MAYYSIEKRQRADRTLRRWRERRREIHLMGNRTYSKQAYAKPLYSRKARSVAGFKF